MAIKNIIYDNLNINNTQQFNELFSKTVSKGVCYFGGKSDFFNYFWIPIFMIVLFFLIIRFKDVIMSKFFKFVGGKGYIKILIKLPNQRIKEVLKKLDSYNTFQFRTGKFSLEKMQDFVFGYDKNGIPIFLYDTNFILPLKVTKKKIDNIIKKEYNLDEILSDEKINKSISQISLKIEPSILRMVYNKKLLSDLYDASTNNELKTKLIYIAIGIIAFIVLYQMGVIDKILSYLA